MTSLEQFLIGDCRPGRSLSDCVHASKESERDTTYLRFEADQRAIESGLDYRPLVQWVRAGANSVGNIPKKQSVADVEVA
jgi:hypothetical protein